VVHQDLAAQHECAPSTAVNPKLLRAAPLLQAIIAAVTAQPVHCRQVSPPPPPKAPIQPTCARASLISLRPTHTPLVSDPPPFPLKQTVQPSPLAPFTDTFLASMIQKSTCRTPLLSDSFPLRRGLLSTLLHPSQLEHPAAARGHRPPCCYKHQTPTLLHPSQLEHPAAARGYRPPCCCKHQTPRPPIHPTHLCQGIADELHGCCSLLLLLLLLPCKYCSLKLCWAAAVLQM
jgi:hypothetical protein